MRWDNLDNTRKLAAPPELKDARSTTMSVKSGGPRKGVVQTTKSVWVVVATLIAALLLESFGAATRVAAQGSVALPNADRSADLAGYQSQASATLAYTDVYRFYVDRSIAQGKQTASPLPYADLSQFYVERMVAQSTPVCSADSC
jgi:hypothetical protein